MQPTDRDTIPCEDILAHLSEDEVKALETWRYLADLDSVHLGGCGRTKDQIDAATRAWYAVSPYAQTACIDMLHATIQDLIDAIQYVGVPEAKRDIDAVVALLGHDHPAFRILPAYFLVDAYMEALDQIGA